MFFFVIYETPSQNNMSWVIGLTVDTLFGDDGVAAANYKCGPKATQRGRNTVRPRNDVIARTKMDKGLNQSAVVDYCQSRKKKY